MKTGVRAKIADDEFEVHSSKVNGQVRVLVQFGIPAFFYMSGIASTFFNTERNGFWQYMKARFVRLIIPFIVSCILLLTPRMYLS